MYGYSRAVVAGDRVHVSGTVAAMPDSTRPPLAAADQARRCYEIIAAALAEAGAALADVVRVTIYLARLEDFDAVGRVNGELFAETRPACTAVVVASLIEPQYLVEIEVEAWIAPAAGGAA